MGCCCWCIDAADALIMLMLLMCWCCWCTDAADALMLLMLLMRWCCCADATKVLMHCCCECADAADGLLLLLLMHWCCWCADDAHASDALTPLMPTPTPVYTRIFSYYFSSNLFVVRLAKKVKYGIRKGFCRPSHPYFDKMCFFLKLKNV